MGETIASAFGFLSCVLGAAWLALAMRVHWSQAFGVRPQGVNTALILRIMGGGAFAGAFILFLQASHLSMASLVWIMSLAGSALIVAMLLAWRPRLLTFFTPWVLIQTPAKR